MLHTSNWWFVLAVASFLALPVLGAPASDSVIPVQHIKRGFLDDIIDAKPVVNAPATAEEVLARMEAIRTGCGKNKGPYNRIVCQIRANILPAQTALTRLNRVLMASLDPVASTFNVNPRNPPYKIYPREKADDAPYSVRESQLRAAIQIPKGFTYGRKTPVIFVPGTTSYGGESYKDNIGKYLTDTPYADPVWLNVRGAFLEDAQNNAEHVAYAINYIASITGCNVTVVGWSQGGLSTQWALTFWPSARAKVSDFLAVSSDFHGDIFGKVFCLTGPTILDDDGQPLIDLGLIPCPPSVIQQDYDSAFVMKVRDKGGDSAWVPTTTFWSLTDEIVQPMIGNLSSAYLKDEHGAGVTNVQIQSVCQGKLAGGPYGHIGMLANPLVAAGIIDAITHPGPADFSRINLDEVCDQVIPPGLTVNDFIHTLGLAINCGLRLFTYQPRLLSEPRLKDYATQ